MPVGELLDFINSELSDGRLFPESYVYIDKPDDDGVSLCFLADHAYLDYDGDLRISS